MKKKNNNNKKEKPSYAKMFKEQIKKESTNSNKSNIPQNDKNDNNKENIPEKNEKKEIKPKSGINFDNLSDWDNIVYPGDKQIKEIINNVQENNIQPNIDNTNIQNNNNNYIRTGKFELNKNDFQNNNEEEDENNIENEPQENFNNNLNQNNNINNGIAIAPIQNNLHDFSVNTSEFTNKNDILNAYDNISLGTNNIDNNLLDKKNSNQNIFNENAVSQIKPIEFGLGLGNNINNVIKEEDSLEQEEENIKNNNINNKENELNDLKAERDIMEQMEEEINLSMDQMNELAGNLKGNSNKGKINKNIKKNEKKDIGNKNKKIYLKNDKSLKGNNNSQNAHINNNINNNKMNNNIKINNNPNINPIEKINNVNKDIAINNLNNNTENNAQNNYFNSNNFSFKPTNIQQISSEEVNKFIQNTQQQSSYPQTQPSNSQQQIPYSQQQSPYPKQQISIPQQQIPIPQQQFNNQIINNQPQIINNINTNGVNINNPNIQNNIPLYPSPYPMVIGQNSTPPQQIYNMPFNINMPPQQMPPGIYPYPIQNINYPQFPIMPQNQMNLNSQQKTEKKKVNYKPKSLKEYKEKYNNGVKEHRGGLGANIGGEEWEHKKEQNMKVKKYSEMIKNQNKEKENNFKKKFKLKNELNDQLYDSLSEEVIEDEKKEKKQKISENSKEKVKSENKKENDNEKRPESNKVRYLMNLKKEKENKEKKEEKKGKQQGKYSKYTKIVIESIDKGNNPNEKKLGKIYTTFKPKQQQRRPSTKDKKQLIKPPVNNENKMRSQSTGFKKHGYKKDDYDDELTKQFMSPNPNNYNGFANNKDNNNNNFIVSPTFEIENLINKKNQYDDKIKEIKKFLKK